MCLYEILKVQKQNPNKLLLVNIWSPFVTKTFVYISKGMSHKKWIGNVRWHYY